MEFIKPLNLEVWITQVFAGTPEIFLAIALLVIFGMGGYFRMNMMSVFFMIGIFLLMLTDFIPPSMIVFIAIIAGLLIGYSLSKFTSR